MLDLRNIDCMKLMAEYPDKHFDIAIVDPPYGIDRAEWDNRPTAEYWKELFRVSKEQIVFGGNYFGLPITENWLCWDKTNNGKSFFKHKAKFELIWLSIETKPDFIRYTLDGNVEGWEKPRPNYEKIKAIHSCQKPVPVYQYLLDRYVTEGMKICKRCRVSPCKSKYCLPCGHIVEIKRANKNNALKKLRKKYITKETKLIWIDSVPFGIKISKRV